jgi:hypothetical protein
VKLKDIFQKLINEKLAKYKKELKVLIDDRAKDELKKLGLKNKEVEKLSKMLNGSLSEFSNTERLLNKYENDLKSQTKNRAKDKAKDLLKSLKF